MRKNKGTDNYENAEEFAKIITAAFNNIPYPGDNNIAPKAGPYDFESEMVNKRLRGKHWSTVDLVKAKVHNLPTVFLLSPEGFLFFLPAFMLASKDILFELTPPEDDKRQKSWFDSRIPLLSAAQMDAVREYILHMEKIAPNRIPNGTDGERFFTYWFPGREMPDIYRG